jgi:hypothetical protein
LTGSTASVYIAAAIRKQEQDGTSTVAAHRRSSYSLDERGDHARIKIVNLDPLR